MSAECVELREHFEALRAADQRALDLARENIDLRAGHIAEVLGNYAARLDALEAARNRAIGIGVGVGALGGILGAVVTGLILKSMGAL